MRSGCDLRGCSAQQDTELRHRTKAVDLRRVEQQRVDATDALDGVEQDGPETTRRDDDDLHRVEDAEEQHQDGDHDRCGNGSEEFQRRFDEQTQPTIRADQHAQADTDHGSQRVTAEQSEHTGEQVADEPSLTPRRGELLDDRRERREVRVGAAGGQEPPSEDQDDWQRERHERLTRQRTLLLLASGRAADLRAHDSGSCLGVDAHCPDSFLTDGCQNSALASTKRAITLTPTPRMPATTISAYIIGTAFDDCAIEIC